MANITTVKESILVCRDAGITMMLWGHRGLGKSSIVNQVAAENGWGFIDFRASQIEASDIRGLPDRVDGRTAYLPPTDMPSADLTPDQVQAELLKVLGISNCDKVDAPTVIMETLKNADLDLTRRYNQRLQELQPRFQKGILFLDEVNRAQDDVLQALFQLILDRRVGSYVLPPGWTVVAAGNYSNGYMVGGFTDAAFINRFCHIDLSGGESTLEEWIDHMSMVHAGDATEVIEFASQNTKHLDGEIQGDRGFTVQPSRRTWEMVVKVQKVCQIKKYRELTKLEVYSGLIGRELAHSFIRYSCPVKPRDIIKNGVKPYATQLAKLTRNQITGLMWGLVSFCKTKVEEDEHLAEMCLDFADFMLHNIEDKDVVVAFCRALVSNGDSKDGQDKARAAVISNPRLAEMIAKFQTKNGNGKKTFIQRLVSRPSLQSALSKVAWGTTSEDKI